MSIAKVVAMFGAVLTLFFVMIVLSQLYPVEDQANQEMTDAVKSIDPDSPANAALDAANSIPDPKRGFIAVTGNFLLNLANNSPNAFVFLALVVAIVLVLIGVSVTAVKAFAR